MIAADNLSPIAVLDCEKYIIETLLDEYCVKLQKYMNIHTKVVRRLHSRPGFMQHVG